MKKQEAHIAGIGIAVPYPISTDRFLEMDKKMRVSNHQSDDVISRMQKLIKGTGINNRHFCHPHWLPEGESSNDYPEARNNALQKDIFSNYNYTPPFYKRMALYDETCVTLAIEASRKALVEWGGDPKDISHIVTTCTSGWNEPGIAISVISSLGLSLDCQKAELNFNGCFCGATCLRIARDIIRAGDATGVLVVACEVSSTHFDIQATDVSSLVAHSLFADGAAAVVLAPKGKWKYTNTGMSVVPESEHLLRLTPPTEKEHTGYRMYLDRTVGKSLGSYFSEGLGIRILEKVYDASQSTRPILGIHPGGPNILDNLDRVFQDRGWSANAMELSYKTLQNYGNLGAAALLFVLWNCWKSDHQDHLITLAFGPGVTVEWATLERVS